MARVKYPAPFGFTHLDWLKWREREARRLLERILAELDAAKLASLQGGAPAEGGKGLL